MEENGTVPYSVSKAALNMIVVKYALEPRNKEEGFTFLALSLVRWILRIWKVLLILNVSAVPFVPQRSASIEIIPLVQKLKALKSWLVRSWGS